MSYIGKKNGNPNTDFLEAGGELENHDLVNVDASGNLLVGKTSIGTSTAGLQLRGDGANGLLQSSRTSGEAGAFHRLTNDGDVVRFYKDTTQVGSIGASGGDLLIQSGANHSGVRFGTGGIVPTYNGSVADNTIDFGSGSERFKNLYLSGGVYVGGTGSANKLDDYEEGTWTPVDGSGAGLTFTVVDATYTKVGRIVTCYAQVNFPSNSSSLTGQIGGLPFTNIVGSASSYGAFTVFATKPDVTWLNSSGGAGSQSYDTNGAYISNASLAGNQFRLVWVYAQN